MFDYGSSPRTRGTCFWPASFVSHPRFIPAHAGNMVAGSFGECKPPVHPRARGEHESLNAHVHGRHGSSPRTRGTLYVPSAVSDRVRFIPAHAGNIAWGIYSKSRGSVHPRARGEHFPCPPVVDDAVGSSPRTRGTWNRPIRRLRRWRFIPAHAGNIKRRAGAITADPVHPRARGEHGAGRVAADLLSGSSPRTRGTFSLVDRRQCKHRFIPAHAGNIAANGVLPPPFPVHPRARGEHLLATLWPPDQPGSSPRTRGTSST